MPGQASDAEHFKFGDVAVALGLLSLEQVRQSAEKLAGLHAGGERKSLGELLIEDGLLTADEVRLVLSEQGVEMLVCSNDECGLRWNIANYDPAKLYRCKECAARLGFPGLFDRNVGYDLSAGDSAATWKPPPADSGDSKP